MYTSNINSRSPQSHFPTFMAANIHTQTKAYLVYTHTHKPKAEYSTCGLHVHRQQWHTSTIDNKPDRTTPVGYILFGLFRLATETWICDCV